MFLFKKAQYNALKLINTELINLYWKVGEYIHLKLLSNIWGDRTIDELAEYISKNYPDIKGFTKRNLYWMKQFYETYFDNENLYALRTQLKNK